MIGWLRILFVCIFSTAAAISSAEDAVTTEPQCWGKPLSYWIELLKGADLKSQDSRTQGMVHQAISNPADSGPWTAYQAIRQIGPEAVAAIPVLTSLLRSKDHQTVLNATDTLGCIGRKAIPALASALEDENPKVREAAAWGMARLKGDAFNDAFPALIHAAEDPFSGVRAAIAFALSEARDHSDKVLPTLRKMLRDQEMSVRWTAANGVFKLSGDTDSVLDIYGALLRDKDIDLRANVAISVGEMGEKGAPLVNLLIELLNDSDLPARQNEATAFSVLSARRNAAIALGKIGKPAMAAIPALLDAINTENDPWALHEVVRALGSIRNDAPDVVPLCEKIIIAIRNNDIEAFKELCVEKYGTEATFAWLKKSLSQPRAASNSMPEVWATAEIAFAYVPLDLNSWTGVGIMVTFRVAGGRLRITAVDVRGMARTQF